jgi:hypothetical protein
MGIPVKMPPQGVPPLKKYDLTSEHWREYEFGPIGDRVVYKINDPIALWIGDTTHRVLDGDGIVHCVPVPGEKGCVLRWKVREGKEPVGF